jgi:hypothetical protein
MNPPTVTEPQTSNRSPQRLGLLVGAAGLGVAAALALASLADVGGGRATVARVTYENPTDYALSVEVSSGPGDGWTAAGFVPQRSTTVAEEIPDQGEVWVFRFDSQGATGGELRLSRPELEAAGWRVNIPADVGRRLAASGAPPTP